MLSPKSRPGVLSCLLALALTAQPALAASVYEELVLGELSDDNLAPTAVSFSLGSNLVTGNISNQDEDYFTATVAAGQQIESIVLLNNTPSGSALNFHGVYLGPTYAITANFAAHGYAFFTADEIGSDLLPAMGVSNGNFSGPLGPGTYSFRVDGGNFPAELYGLDFRIGLIPEPSTGALAALGLLLLARRRAACPALP